MESVSLSQKGDFMKIGIIGGGRLGCCLADYLHQHDSLIGITASTKEHCI